MCDPILVFAILEVLTLLQRSCENEYIDEVCLCALGSRITVLINKCFQYNPVYEFHSDRSGITLQLTDSYLVRNEILGQLKRNANTWFELALGRAPMELQSTLQVDILAIELVHVPDEHDRNTLLLTSHLLGFTLRNWELPLLKSLERLWGQYTVSSVSKYQHAVTMGLRCCSIIIFIIAMEHRRR